MQAERKGFTTIELLVAIGILVVLAGIVVVGLGRLIGHGSAQETKTMLGNCTSLVEEMRQANNLKGLPDLRPGNVSVRGPGDPAANLLKNPDKNPLVLYTARVLDALQALPQNRRAFENIPPQRLMKLPASELVVIRDGWNNPIIYVPGPNLDLTSSGDWQERYGLNGVVTGKGKEARALPTVVSPPGAQFPDAPNFNRPAAVKQQLLKLGTFRPFWVSAGPDGNLATGDDNIYSFEN